MGPATASTYGKDVSRDDRRVAVVLLDLADEPALVARLGELCMQTSGKFDTIIVSGKAPCQLVGSQISKELGVTWIIPTSSALSASIVAGAQATTAGLLVVASSASALSPDCVDALSLALMAIPEAIVTGQVIRMPPQATDSVQVFSLRGMARRGFLGGPICLGAFENCFGGLPFGIRRDVLLAAFSPDSAVTDIWPLLTVCALAGHRILSLPVPLATEPPIQHASPWRDNHCHSVRRLYRSRVPPSLRCLVHIGQL
jgi:hypothetical protein